MDCKYQRRPIFVTETRLIWNHMNRMPKELIPVATKGAVAQDYRSQVQ